MNFRRVMVKNKGQMFSGEFMVSYLIFITAVVLTLYLWNANLLEITSTEKLRDMNDLGAVTAEQLVKTGGYPSNWSVEDVLSVGLANKSRVLDGRKLGNFSLLMSNLDSSLCPGKTNYVCNRHLLGLKGYDFLFNLTYMNGSGVEDDGIVYHTGRPPVNETDIITVVRTALYEGSIVRSVFTIWTR